MSKQFMQGTDLFEFESMMQELPHHRNYTKEDKLIKKRYMRMLERLIAEGGYISIKGRIMKSIRLMSFEDFYYADREHASSFGIAYSRYMSQAKEKVNNKVIAVMYLLTATPKLSRALYEYMKNRKYVLPEKIQTTGEEAYNLYQMAKKILGDDTVVTDEDFLEPEIIEDKILCIMINALFLQKFGFQAIYEDSKRKEKPKYINTPKYHRRKSQSYRYNNQTVKIRK